MSDLKQEVWDIISKLDGWCDETRSSMFIDLILNHRPKVVVEIGVFGGRSLIAMGMALRQLGSGYCVGIDPWSKEAAIEGETPENVEWWGLKVDLEQVYATFVQNILNLKLTNECRWIRDTAEAAAPLFPDDGINLLSLDSNHSELVSCRQVTEWIPKIAPQGVLIIDDVTWASQAKALEIIRKFGFVAIREVVKPDASWIAFQKP